MSVLIYFAIFYVALAIILFGRLIGGPTSADRLVAADSIDLLATCAFVLFALNSGRSIYLDVALVVVLLGFVGSVMVSKYMEGSL